jgi:hypothetical protein
MEKSTTGGQLGRYFAHGLFFSILMGIVLLVWAFILGFLVVFGFILGLIVGLGLLFVFMGAINAFVTENVWNVRMQTSFGTDLVHGFVLFLVLVIVTFPVSTVLTYLFPAADITTAAAKFILQLIILAFIDGYVAKGIAGTFEAARRGP